MNPSLVAEWKDCPGCAKCKPKDGWILRQGSGRPTSAHEHIFFFGKTSNCFFDTEAVRENYAPDTLPRLRRGVGHHKYIGRPEAAGGGAGNQVRANDQTREHPSTGRNIRNVWRIQPAPYRDTHYAVFPPELPKRCIEAATSEKGCCAKCGMPVVRMVSKEAGIPSENYTGQAIKNYASAGAQNPSDTKRSVLKSMAEKTSTIGWLPSCDCNADTVPALVLDCFVGSGTTAMVAAKLGRDYLGIDLNEDCVKRQCPNRIGLGGI